MSSAMSGTFANARAAAMGYKLPITVIDSKATSMGLGYQLLAMAKAAEANGSISEIAQAAAGVREKLQFRVALNTLNYLIKGGRVSGVAKRLGHMLKLKPQLKFNLETGNVDPGDLTTSREKAIEALYNSVTKKIDKTKPVHMAVMHNLADEEAQQLAERVKKDLNPVDLSISVISPILGTHAGPGALALCGYTE
jgi:DegV family protein with EDD domain